MPPDPDAYLLRPVTPDDVEAYVRCHVECLAETYASLMPPEFVTEHRAAIPTQVARTRAAWRASAGQPGPRSAAWLATDEAGAVVGVAGSGPGAQDWETALGAPPTTVPFQLHHLYTRRHTHGSGLGRRLLEVAVGTEATYLWILQGNERADRFYRRCGFVPDGDTMSCGPTWFHQTLYRLVRGPGEDSVRDPDG